MIQRIQTVFMLIATALISLMLFFSLADFNVKGMDYSLRADSLMNMTSNQAELVIWPLFILLIVMLLMPFVTIFFYKKRMYQIRMLIFSSVLNVLFYGLFFYEMSVVKKMMTVNSIHYSYWILAMPLIAVVFNIMSIRRIGQDEMLIRSLNSNRIR